MSIEQQFKAAVNVIRNLPPKGLYHFIRNNVNLRNT